MKRHLALLLLALAGACASPPARQSALDRIETIVVIYAENHSFDNMYGMFPGANGVANASAVATQQRDHDGRPLPSLPPVYSNGKVDPDYPKGLPNGPFRIEAPPVSRTIDDIVPNPIHAYFHNREQIDGGRNDLFVAMSDRGAWAMGYYDGSHQRVWQWAKRYTLMDNFFMGAFGGSFLNHHWLICACTPEWRDAPASIRAQLDGNGRLKRRPASPASVMDGPVQVFDGQVTPDGYAVNTSQPPYQPSGLPPASADRLDYADPAKLPVPPQTAKTIGDTLSAKGIGWVWYAGGWNAALADGRRPASEKRAVIYDRSRKTPMFQPHHQPFNYYARFAPGTADRARHLKDGEDFLKAIDAGTLPPVAFYKPDGQLNQHPSYTDIHSGDIHIADVLARLEKSPQWPHMLVIVTYDENGGYWDHVPPPTGEGWGDRWGPGSRIPTIVVSPFAKQGFVDHTAYDTTSILKLITERFALEPLPGVRRNMGDLTNALAPPP
ncbi:MAG TPA: acid phosphatase [Usitatibacter sp.]|nr:acid phosphatase [Usitatibacter sp.]